MPSKLYSAARQGIEAMPIEVETDVSSGLHAFSIVGLGDKAIAESKERISSALKNTGFKPPKSFNKRVVVNLAPADIKKEGGIYDVAMALGFLIDSGQLELSVPLNKTLIVGELGLDGKIKPIKGAILYAIYAKENGATDLIVPYKNKNEASLVEGIDVLAPKNIKELVSYLEGRLKKQDLLQKTQSFYQKEGARAETDFSLIKGQHNAKLALEIASAGGHNVLMQGPPGSGKTLLARAAAGILPKMDYTEALDATKIESICARLTSNSPLITQRPFRSPHHSSSESAIIGGGAHLAPGEITRAHRGVLFLDEFPEFHRDVLESLRQPLEEGRVTVARAKGVVQYPAEFMLIAAANPCPCGYFGDKTHECSCTTGSILKYQKKLSGPIADRIDLHVKVPRQTHKKITSEEKEESSQSIQKRVQAARSVQAQRFKNEDIRLNSEMKLKHIKKYCHLEPKLETMLGSAIEKYKLSARAYHSILKTSRTIADLRQEKEVAWPHIALSLQYAKRDNELL